MSNNKCWMVRAGERAFLIEDFIEKNIVAIGWLNDIDLSNYNDLNTIKDKIKEIHPTYKKGKINMSAGQIYRFINEFKINDNVVTYDPNERVYWYGVISTDYSYNSQQTDFNHIREVNWTGKVSRDRLTLSSKNTLGAIMTVFEIPIETSTEMNDIITGKSTGLTEPEDNIDEELEVIKEDFIAKAHEFTKDKVLSIDWDDMQELVAGILRAMGYKTRVSPKGPDRGRDIIASPDGLGLEDPRIMVEVKHRKGSMGVNELRSFIGGLQIRDKGLYVSTGGFSKEAKYEAERSNIPVTLIDADMLVELIFQYYDNFDAETKTLIPLRKLYWPV